MLRLLLLPVLASCLGCMGINHDPPRDGWEVSESNEPRGTQEPDAGVDASAQHNGVVVHPDSERQPTLSSEFRRSCESGLEPPQRARLLAYVYLQLVAAYDADRNDNCTMPAEYEPVYEHAPVDLYLRFPDHNPTWHKFEVERGAFRQERRETAWYVSVEDFEGGTFVWEVPFYFGENVRISIYGPECFPLDPYPPAQWDAARLRERFGRIELRVEQPESGISKDISSPHFDIVGVGVPQFRHPGTLAVWSMCYIGE